MIRSVLQREKIHFNVRASHPLQSWEWGDFRKRTGVDIIRLGRFENQKMVETAQVTFHPIPKTSYTIGYFPKGITSSPSMLEALYQEGKKHQAIFIKLEPNVQKDQFKISNLKLKIVRSAHPLFTRYTLSLNLLPTEEELMKQFQSKTRYNIRVAQKHAVIIEEDNSPEAFEEYLRLTAETTKRQGFFAHDQTYHCLMWESLHQSKVARLLTASVFESGHKTILSTWILFLFNNTLYYPYGASSTMHKNLMANNLLMWEAIRYGKRNGAISFDLWGSLGPDADASDPWFGFHRFKLGYQPRLIEFAGSYDLVINPVLYPVYNFVYSIRKALLNIKRKII